MIGASSAGSCIAPAVVALTALMWVTLPAWLIVAAVLSPVLPGRWRALRLLWVFILYLDLRGAAAAGAARALVLLRASAAGCATPYFEGIHYDLVQG